MDGLQNVTDVAKLRPDHLNFLMTTISARISSGNNLGHRPEWLAAFEKAYGHEPICVENDDSDGLGFLPAVIIQRPILGPLVTSMPFIDQGGPVSGSSEADQILIQSLLEEATSVGAKKVELRCASEIPFLSDAYTDKVTMVLDLPESADQLWKNLDAKVRNQIRKAQKNDLIVKFGGSELLDKFYPIFCVNMRDLGSPVHSRQFFQEIIAEFADDARIAIVLKGKQAIGGLIAIRDETTLTVPWASSLREYFNICPNMILYWETIALACSERITKFDFGRSTRGFGTYRFKKQWGAQELQLYWYNVPISGPSNGSPPNGSGMKWSKLLVDSWSKLPLGIANAVGPKVRKYISA